MVSLTFAGGLGRLLLSSAFSCAEQAVVVTSNAAMENNAINFFIFVFF
jgi:hypothetical protein